MMTAFNRIEFGARVLAAMNGRSCRDVAREAGVSAATLNRVTRGEMPSVPVYLTLSEWLTPSQGLDAATVERCARDLRTLSDDIAADARATRLDAKIEAAAIQLARMLEQRAALATEPHQHGGKGA